MTKPKFPLSNCNPSPEDYERLKAACNNPQPPVQDHQPPFPDSLDLSPDSEEYQRLLRVCTGEDKPRRKKHLPKNFRMSVDVDFDSDDYERLRNSPR